MKMFFLFFILAVNAQYGPGKGPWEVGKPESFGLTTKYLDAAEAATNSKVEGRTCYLVIKKGVIVYEKYRGSGGTEVKRQAWSCTKSMCGALYGITVEQGWANVADKVADRNSDTRKCNKDAQFRHVLTMTGQSPDLNKPTFRYDTDGTQCLDTISDFIAQNNPDKVNTYTWKEKFYADVLGFESMTWTGNKLGCGYGSVTTCRDLARAAQLYLNDGAWPGAGQVMNKEYTQTSRTQIFPNSGRAYGYTVWRQENDPVDKNISSFNGMFSQCAYMSKEHEALIISMGQGDISGSGCVNAWIESRNAIISKDVRHLYNTTQSAEERATEEALAQNNTLLHKEILAMGTFMQSHADQFSAEDISAYKKYLLQHEKNILA